LEYNVKFCDGTSVRYVDVEEVIGQSNSPKRSIVALIAGTAADQQAKSAYVNLKKEGSPSLEYTINGIQGDVIYFADKLDDWVVAVRQWYSPFVASENGFSGAGALLLLGAFILFPIDVWEHVTRHWAALGKGGVYQWVALPALVTMWAVEYFALRLFPRGTFSTGHGKERYRNTIYIRSTVLVVLRYHWSRSCSQTG